MMTIVLCATHSCSFFFAKCALRSAAASSNLPDSSECGLLWLQRQPVTAGDHPSFCTDSHATQNWTRECFNDEGERANWLLCTAVNKNVQKTHCTDETSCCARRVEAREGHREYDRHTRETPLCTSSAPASKITSFVHDALAIADRGQPELCADLQEPRTRKLAVSSRWPIRVSQDAV